MTFIVFMFPFPVYLHPNSSLIEKAAGNCMPKILARVSSTRLPQSIIGLLLLVSALKNMAFKLGNTNSPVPLSMKFVCRGLLNASVAPLAGWQFDVIFVYLSSACSLDFKLTNSNIARSLKRTLTSVPSMTRNLKRTTSRSCYNSLFGL